MLKKFCTDTLPSGPFNTFSSQVYVHFVKAALTSSFTGTWTAEDVTCCSKVSVENQANRNGLYTWNEDDGAYKDDASNTQFLYSKTFSEGPGWWIGDSKESRGIYTLVRYNQVKVI